MRQAYKSSWGKWRAVWSIFGKIRDKLRIQDDAFAFVNLAPCPCPKEPDDKVIPECQRSFPLAELVSAIDARVIFLAKAGPVGRDINIPEETDDPRQSLKRYVVRYGSGSRGERWRRQWKHWLPEEARVVQAFIDC